jgi:hypothetical protein
MERSSAASSTSWTNRRAVSGSRCAVGEEPDGVASETAGSVDAGDAVEVPCLTYAYIGI